MAIATKKLLADGLKELLEKKTLDKITVKELVATCGVNRQTFYYNFQDIYELLPASRRIGIARSAARIPAPSLS